MSKLFATLRNIPKRTAGFVAVLVAAVFVPAALLAWGPDRPTYTIDHPADHITFNSITDNPNIGDERNFVGIRESGTNNLWTDNMNVEKGKEYTVRMYVHNNAASNLNLVAKDVTAKFNLPTTTGKSIQVDGLLSASNATPKEVWDQATFKSSENFNLDYVEGSLKFENNAFGAAGTPVSESVFTDKGALLGYDKLDGKIPGCFQYAGYLTFKVKPQFASTSTFTMSKEVSKHGANQWGETYAAKPGETVDFLIEYKNTGETQQDNVDVSDTLPAGLTYVNGSTVLGNSQHPSGAQVSDNVTKGGINIGSYAKGANAWVIFSAKVADNDKLPKCDANTLINKAKVETDYGSKEDTANVTVNKECQPPVTPEYKCDALTVTKINRTTFKFSTDYTVKNATFKSVTYVVRDEQGNEIARTTNPEYTQEKVGKYTVQAIVTVTVDGQEKTVTSDNCKKPFEVTEVPAQPVYTCDALDAEKISRTKFSFTGTATAEGGAEITGYTFDFGDGKTANVTNPANVEHDYDKAGTYTVKLSVTVKVNGEEKTVTSEACATHITVNEVNECKPGIPTGDERCEEEKCDIPGKEDLPKDSPECVETPTTPETPETPAELPHTGASDSIVAFLGAGSLIAAIGYYVASRRALLGR